MATPAWSRKSSGTPLESRKGSLTFPPERLSDSPKQHHSPKDTPDGQRGSLRLEFEYGAPSTIDGRSSSYAAELLGYEGPLSRSATYKIQRVLRQMDAHEPVLHCVDLTIGDLGASILSESLMFHTNIKEIHLQNNAIGSGGAASLAEALAGGSMLRTLRLDGNRIGVEGAKKLAASLKRHRNLTFLWLSKNNIGDTGTIHMAEVLKENKGNIEWLGLDENRISDKGALALCEALSKHHGLEWLGLDGNRISNEGTIALSRALAGHTKLQFLWMENNQLGDPAAVALANNLRKDELQFVGLEGNDHIGADGVRSLVDALPPECGADWLRVKKKVLDPEWRAPHRQNVDMLVFLAVEKANRKLDPDLDISKLFDQQARAEQT